IDQEVVAFRLVVYVPSKPRTGDREVRQQLTIDRHVVLNIEGALQIRVLALDGDQAEIGVGARPDLVVLRDVVVVTRRPDQGGITSGGAWEIGAIRPVATIRLSAQWPIGTV